MHGALEMASKRRQRLRVVTVAQPKGPEVYDRRASDLVMNAVVSTITVDDPMDPGSRLLVARSLRDDPVAAMHDRRQIDEAQYAGARHWQRAYELAELGGVGAIDPTKEAVDGGKAPEPLSDAQARAFGDLIKAAKALGQEGESLIRDFLGRGWPLLHVAARRNMTTETELKYIGRRVRECLETLAITFGYAMPKRPT